jgi:hypothetical protein
MMSLRAAQEDVLSSAPASFTFSNPPTIGWWRASLGVSLAAVVFLDHFQSVLGASASAKDGHYWEGDWASRWQAKAGISLKQWDNVKSHLGASGSQMLSFSVHAFGGAKGTWIRPTDRFLAIFGTRLETYDATMRSVETKLRSVGGAGNGVTEAAANSGSAGELSAMAEWTARAVTRRKRDAEQRDRGLALHRAATATATSTANQIPVLGI